MQQNFDSFDFENDFKYKEMFKIDSLENRFLYFKNHVEGARAEKSLPKSLGEEPASRLTIEEIMEKVENNESIPGVKTILQKTHQQQSTSTLKPIKKPWEQ